jgi:Kef-type K+ transport system membrane component KefB
MIESWSILLEILRTTQNWLLIGIILLTGHFFGKLSQLIRLPSVVGYLIAGVIFGASLLDIMNYETVEDLNLISDFGLGIVAFLIGTELSGKLMKKMGKKLFIIILAESFGAFILVFFLVFIFIRITTQNSSMALATALVFAAMAPASAPAGTVAVIQEYRAKGKMTSLLLAFVGLDDGLAIIIYAFAIAGVKIIIGGADISFYSLVCGPLIEIIGALLLGSVIGFGLTFLTGKTRNKGEILTLSIGGILLATGLANALHLSLILSNLAVGTAMVNASSHTADRSYKSINQITHPVYVLFFVLAGAHLDLHILLKLSFIAPLYIIGRSLGKITGAYTGGVISKSEDIIRRYLGLGILSQAGVAIGLALMVNKEFGMAGSAYGESGRKIAILAINTIAATTIFFEIIGPIFTRYALKKAGEIGDSTNK